MARGRGIEFILTQYRAQQRTTSKCHLYDIVGAGLCENCEYAGHYCFFGNYVSCKVVTLREK